MIKRFFDILFSFLSLTFLLPVFVIISLLIVLNSKGGVFYSQLRVGKNQKDFKLVKFRTMFTGSEKKGLLTVGKSDSRITSTGKWLRKSKLDELPQLLNILKGEMSFVGPRPEVRRYVDLYDKKQRQVLSVRPGLTDYASIEYVNENEILAKYTDPEKAYIETIMPAKLKLNMKYIREKNLLVDLKIIFRTIGKIFYKN